MNEDYFPCFLSSISTTNTNLNLNQQLQENTTGENRTEQPQTSESVIDPPSLELSPIPGRPIGRDLAEAERNLVALHSRSSRSDYFPVQVDSPTTNNVYRSDSMTSSSSPQPLILPPPMFFVSESN